MPVDIDQFHQDCIGAIKAVEDKHRQLFGNLAVSVGPPSPELTDDPKLGRHNFMVSFSYPI